MQVTRLKYARVIFKFTSRFLLKFDQIEILILKNHLKVTKLASIAKIMCASSICSRNLRNLREFVKLQTHELRDQIAKLHFSKVPLIAVN